MYPYKKNYLGFIFLMQNIYITFLNVLIFTDIEYLMVHFTKIILKYL